MKKNFPSLLWNTGRAESTLDSFPISMSLILFWEYHYEQVDFYIFVMFQSIPCSHYLLYFLMLKISLFLSSCLAASWLLWFDSFFLLLDTVCPRLILYFICMRPEISHFTQKSKFLLLKVVFINHTWGNKDAYCYWITEYLSFSVENMRKYVFFCEKIWVRIDISKINVI